MSATEIANAYVALHASFDGNLSKDVKQHLGGTEAQFDEAGAVGGKKFSAAAAVAIAAGVVVVAAAVAKVVSRAVMAFGELEQNIGGSEAVFGQYADTVQKKGVDAYRTLGLSQSDYLATANKMGALFQGSGIEQVRALELTTSAMQRAADMASVMGIEQSVAMESVAGAAKGNFTMMDNLGVAMNATSIEAYAAAQGMTDWSFATATAAEKAEMAMAMFMDSTSQYAGNFEREATETVTGSIGLMGAAWQSLVAGFGDPNADMSQLTTNLVDAFRAVVKNVAPVVGEIFASLPEVFASLGGELGAIVSDMLGGLAGDSGFGKLIGQFVELWGAISPIGLAFKALEPLIPMLSGLFTQLSGALLPIAEMILPVLTTMLETLLPIISSLLDAVVPLIEPLLELVAPLLELAMVILEPLIALIGLLIGAALEPLKMIFDALVPVILGVVTAVMGVLKPAIEMITTVLSGVLDFIGGVFTGNWEKAWNGIVSIFSGIWNGMTGIVKGIINGIIDIVNGAIRGINSLSAGVSDLTGGAISFSVPKIPRLAEGGIVKAQPGGIVANIGEGRYDEAVVPLSPSVLAQLGGGGLQPGDRVIFEIEGTPLTAVAKRVVSGAAAPVSPGVLRSRLG